MERRAFLVRVVLVVAALASGGLVACRRDEEPPSPDAGVAGGSSTAAPLGPARFFTAEERRTLDAVLERLLPADAASGAPGAVEVGVADFIDAQLRAAHFAALERMMRTGLSYLERLAQREHKRAFTALSGEQQDAMLQRFQEGSVRGMKFPQARFFSTLHTFALEGYWGAPSWGGNRGKAAWRWVGIDPSCGHLHGSCGP